MLLNLVRHSAPAACASPIYQGGLLPTPAFIRIALAVSLAFPFVHAQAQDSDASKQPVKRLVGDYDSGSKFNTPPYTAAQIPYSKLTHIIHSGVGFDADGNLQVPDQFIEPTLIPSAHAAGTKVMLLIGGDVTGLEANPGAVPALVKNLKAFVKKYDYDGLDLDWEYPATTEDGAFLLTLETAFRVALPSPRYTLSIDAAPWGGSPYNVAQVKDVIDFFNIMTYDCAGPWTAYGELNSPIFWDPADPAPFECEPGGSDQQSAEIYLAQAPASQLNQGTPFYGYKYTNINQLFGLCPNAATTADGECDNTVKTVNYGTDVKPLLSKKAWVSYRDPVALVPYLLRKDGAPGFITYDDPLSTYTRVIYSDWVQGLGGTFLWSLDEDYDGTSQDLLDAMHQATNLQPLAVEAP
jgi:chitinase